MVGEFTTHFRTYFSGDWDVHWGPMAILFIHLVLCCCCLKLSYFEVQSAIRFFWFLVSSWLSGLKVKQLLVGDPRTYNDSRVMGSDGSFSSVWSRRIRRGFSAEWGNNLSHKSKGVDRAGPFLKARSLLQSQKCQP